MGQDQNQDQNSDQHPHQSQQSAFKSRVRPQSQVPINQEEVTPHFQNPQKPHKTLIVAKRLDLRDYINYYEEQVQRHQLTSSCSQLVQEIPNQFQVSGFNNIQYQDIKSSQMDTSEPLVMDQDILQFPQASYWSKSKSHLQVDDLGYTFGKKNRKAEDQE